MRFKSVAVTVVFMQIVYTSFYVYHLRLSSEETRVRLSRKHADKTTQNYPGHDARESHGSFAERHIPDSNDWSKDSKRESRDNNSAINNHGKSENVKAKIRRVKLETQRAERPAHLSINNDANETRHIAFLKVHKAGSSTIQNILYRFGLSRNLTFMLSNYSHYLSREKFYYSKIMPLPKFLGETARYDIACNHAVFNEHVFRSWLYPDAEYVAIVREPVSLFLSAAYYYRDVWPMEYITRLDRDSFITDLIAYPGRHEPRDLTKSKTFNFMTRDFGFVIKTADDVHKVEKESFQKFLKRSSETFKLVMIMEKFDESLVLLKRRFHWSIKDILYVKNNVYQATGPTLVSKDNLTSSDMQAFRQNYWMDIQLYDHFKSRFDKQIRLEKGFSAEVKCFKNYLSDVQQFCSKPRQSYVLAQIFFPESTCSDPFYVTMKDCSLMLRQELNFYNMLVRRHATMLQ